MFQNVQQIQDFIRQNGIAFLDFKMIDLRGRWKHLSIPAARFNEDIMTHGIAINGMILIFSIYTINIARTPGGIRTR